MDPAVARQLWQALEPYHALVYFAPEPRDRLSAAGLKGFWMGYFASRAAAMGPVAAAVVTATFFGFHPRKVARAIPDAWGFAGPDDVLAARQAGVDDALRRLLGEEVVAGAEIAEAARLAREAAEAAGTSGRPLGAAHLALPWPDEPHLVLWRSATVLREHRGDGHVAALVAAGLDSCQALVTHAAAGAVPRDVLQSTRGWSDDEWAGAEQRLRARGWLDAGGRLTAEGAAGRQEVEDRTDQLALAPWPAIGADAAARLRELMRPLSRRITEGGGVPFPNAMGVPSG